jgi:2-keto-3-deoxygluconate permease
MLVGLGENAVGGSAVVILWRVLGAVAGVVWALRPVRGALFGLGTALAACGRGCRRLAWRVGDARCALRRTARAALTGVGMACAVCVRWCRRLARQASGVPGAAVLVPLTAGIVVGTCVPGVVEFGSFTKALGSQGALSFVGLMLVAVGAQVTPSSVPPVAARIVVILAGATVVTGAGALAYGALFGAGGVDGVSLLAVAAAGLCTSNALWLALARRYGSAEDVWGGAVAAAINSGPVVPLLVLAVWSHSQRHVSVSWLAMVDALLPLLVGFVAGVLVPACRAMLRPIIPVLMVVFSFDLGLRLNLRVMNHQLIAGLGLGAAVAVVSGALVGAGWTLVLHQPAAVGWAAGGITIGAPLVPGIVADASPSWGPYAAAATAQVGLAVIASTLVTPFLAGVSAQRRAARHRSTPPTPAGHPGTAPGSVQAGR